jgi:hypothetical protein
MACEQTPTQEFQMVVATGCTGAAIKSALTRVKMLPQPSRRISYSSSSIDSYDDFEYVDCPYDDYTDYSDYDDSPPDEG